MQQVAKTSSKIYKTTNNFALHCCIYLNRMKDYKVANNLFKIF